METQIRSGLAVTLRGIWERNADLLRNAGSLAGTTGLTSAFGFVYWIIAAREFTLTEVGYGSAAISAMGLLGTIGMFGLGTMLIGELPKRTDRGGLLVAVLLVSGLGSLLLGLGFSLVAAASGGNFPEITGTPFRILLFAVGVALTGSTLVLDESTIGLLRGGVQLMRNLAMSGIKLAALPLAAVVLHDKFGVGLLLAWIIGTLLSLIPVAYMLKRDGSRILHRPDFRLLRRLGKVAMAHNWLNLAIATPPKLIPVLVTVVVSPKANAAFYVAWMLVAFLFMVPASLSTVLFAIASAAPELIAEKLRFVLRMSIMIGVPAMIVLALGAHFALSIFGPGYAQIATVPLWLLALTYIPGIPTTQYIAVSRATGKVAQAAVLLTVIAACQLGAVVIGGKLGGLDGLSIGYLIVTVAASFVTTPTVYRAAYVRSPDRKAATGAFAIPSTVGVTGPLRGGSDYLQRQQKGMAALLALASASVAEGHARGVTVGMRRTGASPSASTIGPDNPPPQRRRAPAAGYGPPSSENGHEADYSRRQQAGLDALIAMAQPAGASLYAAPKGVSRPDSSESGSELS